MESLDTRFDKLENPRRIGYLIGGSITGTLTIEEREELDAWVSVDEDNMQLYEDMTDEGRVDEFLRWLSTRDTESRLIDTKRRLKFKRKARAIKWWHYAAAACIFSVIGLTIFYNRTNETKGEAGIVQEKLPDILPGSTFAELRLPSGQVIKLDGVGDTVINNIQIRDGQIVYGLNESDTLMHEVIIPRKGFYQLVLPDGSKVWLNAESSIRYPGAFSKAAREVAVSGETFFEVAKDPARPFIVFIADIKVQAVGTAFNVNSFDKTVTLTEGIVRVSKENKSVLLKPGQQLESGAWKIIEVETDPVTAWTRNQFKFKNATIEEVMRPVQRWYDAKVIYEGKISYHFNGTIDRSVPVSKVLELLEGTGHVHFTIEGSTITVKN